MKVLREVRGAVFEPQMGTDETQIWRGDSHRFDWIGLRNLRYTIYDLRACRFALGIFGDSDGFARKAAREAVVGKVVATGCRHPNAHGLTGLDLVGPGD